MCIRDSFGRCDALAQGAAQAAKAMGRDDILVVGFDGDRAALQDLKNNNTLLAATMTQQTLTIGRNAVRFAIDPGSKRSSSYAMYAKYSFGLFGVGSTL